MSVDEESRIEESLKRLYPDVAPSGELAERVAAMAAAADARAAEKRRYRGWALAAATVAAATAAGIAIPAAVNLISPKPALADTLRKVSANIDNSRGYHCRITIFHNAKVFSSVETWAQDGRWRSDVVTEKRTLTRIFADGKSWRYDPAAHRAWLQRSGGGEAVDTEQFRRMMRQALNNPGAVSLGTVVRDDHRLQGVTVPEKAYRYMFGALLPRRTVFWVDLDRMLPVSMEEQYQVRNGRQWTPELRVDYDFDHPITPDIFRVPTKDVSVVD